MVGRVFHLQHVFFFFFFFLLIVLRRCFWCCPFLYDFLVTGQGTFSSILRFNVSSILPSIMDHYDHLTRGEGVGHSAGRLLAWPNFEVLTIFCSSNGAGKRLDL